MSNEHDKPGRGRWKTGATPTPRHKLLAAQPFKPRMAAPPMVTWLADRYDPWGNEQYGDCVTAEEAWAKAVYGTRPFISEDAVIQWARRGGFLNGANLAEVMDAMIRDGFHLGSQAYNDGHYQGVDYSNETVLRAALAVGPVKIAIDHSALPNGAGSQQGWFRFGGRPGEFGDSDHCVGIGGYGTAEQMFGALKVSIPGDMDPKRPCYLLYTWATVGVVDHDWLMSTCSEAWIRQPTTVGVPPLPEPTPTPPTPTPPGPAPEPPCPPCPAPSPNWLNIIVMLLPIILQLIQQLLPHLQRLAAQHDAPGGTRSGPGQQGYEFGHAQQPRSVQPDRPS